MLSHPKHLEAPIKLFERGEECLFPTCSETGSASVNPYICQSSFLLGIGKPCIPISIRRRRTWRLIKIF